MYLGCRMFLICSDDALIEQSYIKWDAIYSLFAMIVFVFRTLIPFLSHFLRTFISHLEDSSENFDKIPPPT